MEHIKMSILQLYIDHFEPLKVQGLNCWYTAESGFTARPELLEHVCRLPQLQLMSRHLLYIK